AAVRSSNDAATAIAEAISGSEDAFARRMTRTAKAMGMTRTTFKNAHGLTQSGHMSTARDMTILGRHVLYDYPQYYNIFSRQSTDAGITTVRNTNRRMLQNYKGADGIKTGYTRAAGFNLVASAERGRERVIATVFGGRSTATRDARVAELLDMGFQRAPTRVALRKPAMPRYEGRGAGGAATAQIGKVVRVKTAVKRSYRPQVRPGWRAPDLLAQADVTGAVAEVLEQQAAQVAAASSPRPVIRPRAAVVAQAVKQTTPVPVTVARAASATSLSPATPVVRPAAVVRAAPAPAPEPVAPTVITRASADGARDWAINVGRYGSKYQAEKALLKVALSEMTTLSAADRRVWSNARGHDAVFSGLTRDGADLACRRLQARGSMCFMVAPS
ncbi:MAG: D-alanyl-D-alanine carboxypeptidase family protein, partial [Shimia sp.]